jgi:hypothetical protein
VISIQEVIMGRALLSVLLATILWVHCGLSGKAQVAAADSSSEASAAQRPTLKEQVTRIPAGSQVEVRLLNQERIRGRLGEVSAEAFTVQVAKGSQIETRRLAFSDVKSVKQLGGGKGKYILIGVGIALVVIVVLAVVVLRNPLKDMNLHI